MLKIFAIGSLLAAVASPALADQKNLDRAVKDAIATYRKGGSDALVSSAKICSSGVDGVNGTLDASPADKAEYCFAFEVASATIINRKPGAVPPTDANYFRSDNVVVRATLNLERARVFNLPEQVNPYMVPRVNYVADETVTRLGNTKKSVGQDVSAGVLSPASPKLHSTVEPVAAEAISSDGPAVKRCGWISNAMPSSLG
ncbi:hypothetical protein [Paraburkholderia sp. GAS348]|uniref:hypothetical protein n=1 Tax=Paraburkholderia sp. GAS348 TaxID=3035132 RepID=UPI003D20C2E4